MVMKRILRVVILLLVVVISCFYIGDESAHASEALDFAEEHKTEIIASARKTGTWPSVTIGQLIWESGHNLSDLARNDNNLFGIKWSDSFAEKYPGSCPVTYWTLEEYDGVNVSVQAQFAHFASVTDCITQHDIIWWNGAYGPELDILYDLDSTMEEFLAEMGNGPYATDSGYGDGVLSVINSYDLRKYDELAFPDGRKFCGYNGNYVGEYNYPNDGYNKTGDVGEVTEDGKNYIVAEKDLIGMFPESVILSDYRGIYLPDKSSLTIRENVNLENIKSNILIMYDWSLWDTVRVIIVFIGLFMLVYAVLFGVAYIFDRTNNLIEISMIGILSLGLLSFSDVEDVDNWKQVNKRGLIRIEIALVLLGLFLVGGGVANMVLDILYYTKIS